MRPAARAGSEIWFQKARNIHGYTTIYYVYTMYIHQMIYHVYPWIYHVYTMYILGRYTTWYIQRYTMYIQSDGYTLYIQGYSIPCIYHVYVGHLHIRNISWYQAYSRARNIPWPKIGVPLADDWSPGTAPAACQWLLTPWTLSSTVTPRPPRRQSRHGRETGFTGTSDRPSHGVRSPDYGPSRTVTGTGYSQDRDIWNPDHLV